MTALHVQNLPRGWRPQTASEALVSLRSWESSVGVQEGECPTCNVGELLSALERRPTGPWPTGPLEASEALALLDLPEVRSDADVELTGDGLDEGPAFTLGVNTVAFETGEPFGDLADLVEDLERLGVGIARHPGGAQLFLEHLLPLSEVTSDAEGALPPRGRLLPIRLEQMDEDVLYGIVSGSSGMAALRTVVESLAARGSTLKLYITLFDLGAGGGTPWGRGTFAGASEAPTRYPHGNPIGVPWQRGRVGPGGDVVPGHEDQVVYDDVQGLDVTFETRAGGSDWDRYTLDPSNAYKRMFFRMLAGAVGRWLTDNDSDDLPLRAHIAGIELCNEIEVFHTRSETGTTTPRVMPDGVSWGRFYYYCASRLRARCAWVPLCLPALATYVEDLKETSKATQWDAKLSFVQRMVREIHTWCALAGSEGSDLVQGIDHHFYHYFNKDAVPLLLAWAETAMLRDALDGMGLPDAQVTMLETATDVLCEVGGAGSGDKLACIEQVPGFDASCPPFVPAAVSDRELEEDQTWRPPRYVVLERPAGDELLTWRAAESMPAYDFQGASVIMRLVLAMVGGARAVGWHTHLAHHGAFFPGTGLREDLVQSRCMPKWLQERKSWYALRRLASLAGTCTAASLVWPEEATDLGADRFRTRLRARTSDANALLISVVELENATWPSTETSSTKVGATPWWAYVLFIDPGWSDLPAGSPIAARVTFRSLSSRDEPTVYRVPLAPEDTVVSAVMDDQYPVQVWSDGASERIELEEADALGLGLQFQVLLALGQWPVVILSTRQLDVSIAEGDLVVR